MCIIPMVHVIQCMSPDQANSIRKRYDLRNRVGLFHEIRIIPSPTNSKITSLFSKSSFLFAEGVLWTMGDNSLSQLGRSTRNVDPKTFGPVPMTEPILAVASGAAHCLAMTANKVRNARLMVGVTFKTLSVYKCDYHASESSLQHGYLINNAQF